MERKISGISTFPERTVSEHDDNSSNNDSDDFAAEEDGAIRDMQNEDLGFLFASHRTSSGRIVKK